MNRPDLPLNAPVDINTVTSLDNVSMDGGRIYLAANVGTKATVTFFHFRLN